LNEEKEAEEEVAQRKGAKKNKHHCTLFQKCMEATHHITSNVFKLLGGDINET
jgi:hypothetical protein